MSNISDASGRVRRESGSPEPRATPPNPSVKHLYFGIYNNTYNNDPTIKAVTPI